MTKLKQHGWIEEEGRGSLGQTPSPTLASLVAVSLSWAHLEAYLLDIRNLRNQNDLGPPVGELIKKLFVTLAPIKTTTTDVHPALKVPELTNN